MMNRIIVDNYVPHSISSLNFYWASKTVSIGWFEPPCYLFDLYECRVVAIHKYSVWWFDLFMNIPKVYKFLRSWSFYKYPRVNEVFNIIFQGDV